MKVVAINGSPRKGGNTAQCLEVMARPIDMVARAAALYDFFQ